MKHTKMLDAALVAALLLAYVPELSQELPRQELIAFICPAEDGQTSNDTPDNPARGH